jgi:hypothetical protein
MTEYRRMAFAIIPLIAALALFGVGGARFGVVGTAKAQITHCDGTVGNPLNQMVFGGDCGHSAPSFSLTYAASNIINNPGSSATVDYGTLTYGSGCSRVIVGVAAVTNSTAFNPVNSISINGVGGSAVSGAAASLNGGQQYSDIWITSSAVSGSSGDVQITYSGTAAGFGISAVFLYCLVTTTPTAFAGANTTGNNTTTATTPLSVPSGGGGIVILADITNSSISSWSDAAQDARLTANGGAGSAHTTSNGSLTVGLTFSSNDVFAVSAASWGP